MKTFDEGMTGIRMSPIVSISEQVRKKAPQFSKETGKQFLLFQRGEIDFPTPRYIKAEGLTRENIVCTYGGQEGLELAFRLFSGKKGAGFAPCWSCVLENFVPFAKIDFIEVPLEADFSIDFVRLEEVIREVAFFYLNTPHNPTGKLFSEAEVTRTADLCRRYGVYLISDEAYERIIYDGRRHFSPLSLPHDNIIAAFTFSKTYAMTGWRLGYLAARNPRIAEFIKLGDYTQTAGVVTFLQHAGKEALENRAEEDRAVSGMVTEFEHRRNLLSFSTTPAKAIHEGLHRMLEVFSGLNPPG